MSARLPDRERSRALLFGAAIYADPDLRDLPGVAANLTDLARVLTDPLVGGLSPERCVVVPGERSLEPIGNRLADLAEQAEDLLLVYYAGHGLVDFRDGELYLALGGTHHQRPHVSGLAYNLVRRLVLDSPARSKVVILDCCYSGLAVGKGMSDSSVSGLLLIDGTYILTSSPANRPALARERDLPHTAFTGQLISLLDGGIRDGEELLTLRDVFEHLVARSRALGLPLPQQGLIGMADQLALTRNRTKLPPRLELSEASIEIRGTHPQEVLVRAIEVRNRGGGQLDWEARSDAGWIGVEAEADLIRLTLNPRRGTNEGTVEVQDLRGGGTGTVVVRVETLSAPVGASDQRFRQTGADAIRWDLGDLYMSPTDPAIDSALAASLVAAQNFEARYRGRIASLAPAEFATMMEELGDYFESATPAALYAHLLHSQDLTAAAAGRLLERVNEASAERGRHLVFFGLELNQLEAERVERLVSDPLVERYRHAIELERRYRGHQLSEAEERVLTEIDPVGGRAWVRHFEEFSSNLTVTVRGDEMSMDNALGLARSADRDLRRDASLAVSAALGETVGIRSHIYNVILQDRAIRDRLRGFPSWISARNLANELTDDEVTAMTRAITVRYDISERYYRIKGRLLGLEPLHEWDRYASVHEETRYLSWHDARRLVLESFERFSPRAARLVRDFFEKPWIDAAPAPGKEGGAYCALAAPRLHPYVLMSFGGGLVDTMTLAGMIGHGLHDLLAARQHIFDYHPPLTLASLGAQFATSLVFDYILAAETDAMTRLFMLCKRVEDVIATVFRQTAMTLFEDAAHNARRQQGELSPAQLGEMWQHQIQRMFGSALLLTDDHRVSWSNVAHLFVVPGYVYTYAYGNLLALCLYQRYREIGPSFVDPYLELLAAGGSRSPHELLREVGLDVDDPAFWRAGLAIVDDMVTQIEHLERATRTAR